MQYFINKYSMINNTVKSDDKLLKRSMFNLFVK